MQPPVPPAPEAAPFRPDSIGPYRLQHARRSSMELVMAVVGIVIGTLIFIGFFSFHAIFLIPPPCTSFSCPSPTPTPQQAAYSSTLHTLGWIAVVALDLSVGLSVAIAFILGARSDLSETTRRSAFYFAMIYLVAYTIFGSVLLSSFFSLLRYI